jgi:hypothetical protein
MNCDQASFSCARSFFVIRFIWANSSNVVWYLLTPIVYHFSRFGPLSLWALHGLIPWPFTLYLYPFLPFSPAFVSPT